MRASRSVGAGWCLSRLTSALFALLVLGCRGEEALPLEVGSSASGTDSPDEVASVVEVLAATDWAAIVPGTFAMGSLLEEPCRDPDEMLRSVTLTRPFAMAVTETTQGSFEALMGYNPSFWKSCGADCPVERVSWHEAASYCNALSEAQARPSCYDCAGSGSRVRCRPTGTAQRFCSGYRLPTEAEWEYAARAGTDSAVYSGEVAHCQESVENVAEIAWYKNNSDGHIHATADKAPNEWGLFDTSGNVSEWTDDWYRATWPEALAVDPMGPAAGTERVFRGGDYFHNADHCRVADRERFRPDKRLSFVGFRCVRTLRAGERSP